MKKQRIKIRRGDALKRLRRVGDNVFHSMVTDPPAGVLAIGTKTKWDHDHGGRDKWIAWMQEIMAEAHRTLRPGAYGVVWSLPRTQHWTTMALENAGFEIVDVVVHLFSRSLIKGMDASKALDGYLGWPRKTVGKNKNHRKKNVDGAGFVYNSNTHDTVSTVPLAKAWEGWRSNLKPSAESWILVRKPLDGNTAENILKHGTGGVRVGKKNKDKIQGNSVLSHDTACTKSKCVNECMIRALGKRNAQALKYFTVLEPFDSAFVYDDKVSRKERGTNRHPTLKTDALMRFLVRLVTPKRGYVLDPFMGSGSTGVACIPLGYSFYGIEKEKEHYTTAKFRCKQRK
jgi:site-specific DNA-methyltransferase (adenine-specific)